MTLAELWIVLAALPWHEVEARQIITRLIETYEKGNPYE